MDASKLFLFFFCLGFVRCGYEEQCCLKGIAKKSAFIFGGDVSCDIDDKTFQELRQKLNIQHSLPQLMCRGFYKQCCITAAKSQYCSMGIIFGNNNQVCLKGTNKLVGEAQRVCCDCCKSGRQAGALREDCFKKQFDEILCTHSYRQCCTKVKKSLPIETTKPPSMKKCKDIVCDIESTASCTETSKGPQCICKTGYIAKNDHVTCIEINECERDQNICTGGRKCTNTPGSFTCSCEKGFKFVDEKCTKMTSTDVECNEGFILSNGTCVDVDECVLKTDKCIKGMYCLNIEGSYQCRQDCNYPYFQLVGTTGDVCKDVNECLNPNTCQKDTHECVNQVGSYTCKRVRCQVGLALVDGQCIDIDECEKDPEVCGDRKYGNCQNTHGSYYCICAQGFRSRDSGKCEDIDECKLKRHRCSFKCVNTKGSHHCACPAGYQTNGFRCDDIDECATKQPCGQNEYCFNTFGSYRCIDQSCPTPYYVRSKQNSAQSGLCQKQRCGRDDKLCRAINVTQIKWSSYKLKRSFRRNGFQFGYSLSGFQRHYRFHFAIAEGDEEQNFSIRRTSRSRVVIYNSKDIKGPKEIHLVFHADVFEYSELRQRFIYKLNLYVSPYDF